MGVFILVWWVFSGLFVWGFCGFFLFFVGLLVWVFSCCLWLFVCLRFCCDFVCLFVWLVLVGVFFEVCCWLSLFIGVGFYFQENLMEWAGRINTGRSQHQMEMRTKGRIKENPF